MDKPFRVERTITIGTIIAISGVAISLIGFIVSATLVYSNIQAQTVAWQDFQKRQESYNSNLETSRAAGRATYDTKLDNVIQTITKLAALVDQSVYQIAQLQKKDEENDARLSRMSESYGNKFTEIQTSLASINTQLALQSQALTEVKQIVAQLTSIKPLER